MSNGTAARYGRSERSGERRWSTAARQQPLYHRVSHQLPRSGDGVTRAGLTSASFVRPSSCAPAPRRHVRRTGRLHARAARNRASRGGTTLADGCPRAATAPHGGEHDAHHPAVTPSRSSAGSLRSRDCDELTGGVAHRPAFWLHPPHGRPALRRRLARSLSDAVRPRGRQRARGAAQGEEAPREAPRSRQVHRARDRGPLLQPREPRGRTRRHARVAEARQRRRRAVRRVLPVRRDRRRGAARHTAARSVFRAGASPAPRRRGDHDARHGRAVREELRRARGGAAPRARSR